jgi:hypothetical protein
MALPPFGQLPLSIPCPFSYAYPFRLVATLGAKSGLKKINRKAILDVNIPKACVTITTPEAPMALRLQSSLLSVVVPLLDVRFLILPFLQVRSFKSLLRAMQLRTDGRPIGPKSNENTVEGC